MPTFAEAVASAQAKAPLMRAASMEEVTAEEVEMTSFSSGLVDAGDGTFAPNTGKEGLVLWFIDVYRFIIMFRRM